MGGSKRPSKNTQADKENKNPNNAETEHAKTSKVSDRPNKEPTAKKKKGSGIEITKIGQVQLFSDDHINLMNSEPEISIQ